MFLPTTLEECTRLGWKSLDVIIVTGDSYVDSPYIGAALIGKILLNAGFHVGIIAQPDMTGTGDISRLGEPRLFWGVTAGSVDSMLANYTASRKKRKSDDYTPGGVNNRRPDRASMVYTNLIRRAFKNTRPIVLGGLEASLRRVAHYDFWDDAVRRSILFDAKADYLLYGMAESSVVALACALDAGNPVQNIRGLCYITRTPPANALILPSYENVKQDKALFTEMFHTFYHNSDPITARGLVQQHGDRFLVQNPPPPYLTQAEMDAVYGLSFERDLHPFYAAQGTVKALETIRFSVSSHRGCYGECNFCAIAVHEGRTVRWRSEDSIAAEVEALTHLPAFKGIIQDVGGPTANMYGFECEKKLKDGACPHRRCLYPKACPSLHINHQPQLRLLRRLRQIKGIRKIFLASGIRYDLILNDPRNGQAYLEEVVAHHTSGQMKIAPEHTQDHILALMGKTGRADLLAFKKRFDAAVEKSPQKQFLTYYLIAAYPGCTDMDMRNLRHFAAQELHIHPEQVQIFTPLPSTYAGLMYYTETNPFTGEKLFVEKDTARKERQKRWITEEKP
ncbi:MAG TPA: YgiQ family radical SAM protein [Anaerolineaceae bacterium]|nr:YgiQ family radical SAM protein [Anaerolineaceae bacterium]HPN51126.1 YgiQ family radical SAM protein [Anaerolineaceae bacterium]